MEKKDNKIAIRYDKTDPAKIIISEELYNFIEDELNKIKDDDIDNDYNYSFYAFGEYEGRFNTYLNKSENLELKRKNNLYTVSSDDMELLSSHFWNGEYCLANVIFHTTDSSSSEDNYDDYINYFNFYNGRVRVLSIVVTENNSKPKLDIFEQISRFNEAFRRDKIYVRVNDKDILLQDYQIDKEKKEVSGNGIKQ